MMTRNDKVTNREGFALPVALMAMVLIGAIVTGGFYAASQENRISLSNDLGALAMYVAEYGLDEVLGTWRNDVLAPVATSASFPEQVVHAGGREQGRYTIDVRRLGAQMFLVSSEGRVQRGPRIATRQVGVLVRSAAPAMPTASALAIYGGLTVGGSSLIDGTDVAGSDPNCLPGGMAPGVAAFDSSRVTVQGSANQTRVIGDPPIQEDATLDTARLSQFGGFDLADLKAAATRIYEADEDENGMAPVVGTDANGHAYCDTSDRKNWGEPDGTGPCGGEFPIIYARGDIHLKTGRGQGILIVEGDLRATGNFDFFGVVIVLGELITTGTGNHMVGTVIVQGNGQLDSQSTSLGNSLVQYSSCRVEQALNAAIRPRPLGKRSWLDFSAATGAL
jgi:hypothetical protein